MEFALIVRKKDISPVIFTLFFCYLFVFQYVSKSYIDEVAIILLLPLSYFFSAKKLSLRYYMLPGCILFAFILLTSTEKHSSFIYYLIMVEAFIFVRPDIAGTHKLIRIIRANAIINSFFVLLEIIFPSIFISYAKLVFSSDSATDYIAVLNRGYYAGINNQVAFTAVYISLGIFIELYFLKVRGAGRNLQLIFMFLALVATNKRSHLIYLVVAILACYFFSSRGVQQINRSIKIVVALLLCGICIYVAAILFPQVTLFTRLTTLFDPNADLNAVTSGRVAIYNQMMELFEENKIVGIGWQNFVDFSKSRSASGGISQGHNVFLQLLCETGIIGFLIVVLITTYYFIRVVKVHRFQLFKTAERNERILACTKFALAAFIFYWLFWLSGNALYDATLFYTWTISIIIAESVRASFQGEKQQETGFLQVSTQNVTTSFSSAN